MTRQSEPQQHVGDYGALLSEQARRLTELKAQAGAPSLRVIASRAQKLFGPAGALPASTLSGVFNGSYVGLDKLLLLVRTLMSWDGERECAPPDRSASELREWRERWTAIQVAKPKAPTRSRNPRPEPARPVPSRAREHAQAEDGSPRPSTIPLPFNGPDGASARSRAEEGEGGVRPLWELPLSDPVAEPRTGRDRPAGPVPLATDGRAEPPTARPVVPSLAERAVRHLLRGYALLPTIEAGQAEAVAFSPDGLLLATGGYDDGLVRFWDPTTSEPVGRALAGHSGAVSAVAFAPDGTLLASSSLDGTVRLWDPGTGGAVGRPLTRRRGQVNAVAFSPDGRLLAAGSGSGDGTHGLVQLWDPRSQELVAEILTGRGGQVLALAFSPDGALLATGSYAGGLVQVWRPVTGLWRPITGESVRTFRSAGGGRVYAVAFSPDGRLLATSGEGGVVQLWDPATGEPVGKPLTRGAGQVEAVAFSPDGHLLATGNHKDSVVRLWSATTRQLVAKPLVGHDDRVTAVAFSPDGSLLATSGQDGRVCLHVTGLLV